MKLFITFELKFFRHKERDTHSFYADFSISPKPRETPVRRPQWASESQPSSSEAELNSLTFPKNLSPRVRCVTSLTSLVTSSIRDFYCDVWMTCLLPHAREHLCSCLHLTNPCTARKVLSLTKLKGKMYKTKPLGHYITCLSLYKIKLFVIDDDKLFS